MASNFSSPTDVRETDSYVGIITDARVLYHKQSRFNPIRHLTPQVLSQQLEDFQAGILRYLALTMESVAQRDDTLKTVIPKRYSAIKRRKWEIMIDPNADPKEAQAHKEVLQYFYQNVEATSALDKNKRGSFPMLVEQMMDAIGKKYSAHEILWRATPEGLTAVFNFVPLQFFENRTGNLRYLQQDMDLDGIALDPTSWMICVGEGLMEACCVAYMYKHLPLKDWLLYCEKHGMPGIHGKTEHPYKSVQWEALKEAVSQVAADFSCVTGATDVIEKLDFSADGELPYPKIVDAMNRSMVEMWRGGDLGTKSHMGTAGAAGGQGTGASLQGDETFNLESADADWVSEHLQIQVDRRVIAYHFGDGTKPLAYVKVVIPELKDSTKDLAIDQFLLTSGAPLSVKEIMERYNRTIPEAGEDLLKAPMAPGGDPNAQDGQDLPSKNGIGQPGAKPKPEAGAKPGRFGARYAANEAGDGPGPSSEVAARDAARRVLAKGYVRLGKAQADDLQPLYDRIEALIEMPNEEALHAGVAKLRADLPDLLREINHDPATAEAIEQTMSAFFFNGVALGVVRQHRGKSAGLRANEFLANADGNCGTGAGGFQAGNKCSGGGSGSGFAQSFPSSMVGSGKASDNGSKSPSWLFLKTGKLPAPETLSKDSVRIDSTSGLKGVNGLKFSAGHIDPASIPDTHLESDLHPVELEHRDNHVSSGAVIVEPDGRLWLVEPKNNFGGYQNTFPKGTHEAGLTLQQNAHKEVHEETGLHIKIKSVLGDFKGDLSTTRYYMAERVGGDPRAHRPDETSAVKLVTKEDARKILNRKRDQKVLDALDDVKTQANEFKGDHAGGQPCGDGWISTDKTCHVGEGSAKASDKGDLPAVATEAKTDPMPKTEVQSKGKLTPTEYPTAHWPAHNSAAQWGSKKIGMMEQMFKDGKFAELKAIDTVPKSDKPHIYSKAVNDAQKKLISKIDAGALPSAIEPAKPAVTVKADANPHPLGTPQNPIDTAGWKKEGGQLGSNPGGVYKDEHGAKWYVKESKSDDHAKAEILSSKLYQLANAPTLDVQAVKVNGKLGVATRWQEGIAPLGVHHADIQEHFATHAWLGNWDAVGATFDNQKVIGGKPTTVDVGGSLMYRAQGEVKQPEQFSSKVHEWDNMRNPTVAPQAAQVFGPMTKGQLNASAANVSAISGHAIGKLVDVYGPGNEHEKLALTNKLIDRRDDIASKIQSVSKATTAVQAVVKEPEVEKNIAPAKNEGAQGSKVGPAIPKPPTVMSETNKSSQKKFDAIFQAALTGDIQNVHNISTKADAKQSYAKGHHKYKLSVIDAMMGKGQTPDLTVPVASGPKPPAVKGPPKAVQVTVPPMPQFVSKNAEAVAQNKKAVSEMSALVAKGDFKGFEAHPGTPSPKVQAWKEETKLAIHAAQNPPEPPKQWPEGYSKLVDGVPIHKSGKDVSEKIGYYTVLANPGVPRIPVTPQFLPQAQFGASKHEDAYNALPMNQQQAIRSYTGSGYTSINESLWNSFHNGTTLSDKARAATAGLHKAAQDLPPGATVIRGISMTDQQTKQLANSVGKVLQEPAMSSTSIKPDWGWHGNVQWRLTATPGAKGLYVGQGISSSSSEKEVILPPNSRYLITAVEKQGTKTIVHGLILPYHKGQNTV